MWRILFFNFLLCTEAMDVSLTTEYVSEWDYDNNCGPRPHGPQYPMPSFEDEGNPYKPGVCDIIMEDKYVYNYKCENMNCQLAPEITVNLKCDCFFQLGPISKVKDCVWKFEDDIMCPEVPLDKMMNWSCDPRIEQCESNQYEIEPETKSLFSISFGNETTESETTESENAELENTESENTESENTESETTGSDSGNENTYMDSELYSVYVKRDPLKTSMSGYITINISPEINQQIGDISQSQKEKFYPDHENLDENTEEQRNAQIGEYDDEHSTVEENYNGMDYNYRNNENNYQKVKSVYLPALRPQVYDSRRHYRHRRPYRYQNIAYNNWAQNQYDRQF